MSEVARLYRYKSLLSGRRAIPAAELMATLEISPATFKRDLAKLRDQMHMPISYDRDLGGYRLEQTDAEAELPGLWFSPQELVALLTIQQMLTQLEPGLLGLKLRPLQQRLADILRRQGISDGQMAVRMQLLQVGKRQVALKNFEAVATATMARNRIRIVHFNRQNGESVERTVSPQQLVYYRDNWYLDAWCHLREGLRSFSVDAITSCDVLGDTALEVAPDLLHQVMQSSYGIFAGVPKAWARLRFSPQRARWVRRETWHPDQRSHTEADGSHVLEIPYSDERELLGDILRFGADVEVLEPADLRGKVKRALHEAMGRYV